MPCSPHPFCYSTALFHFYPPSYFLLIPLFLQKSSILYFEYPQLLTLNSPLWAVNSKDPEPFGSIVLNTLYFDRPSPLILDSSDGRYIILVMPHRILDDSMGFSSESGERLENHYFARLVERWNCWPQKKD